MIKRNSEAAGIGLRKYCGLLLKKFKADNTYDDKRETTNLEEGERFTKKEYANNRCQDGSKRLKISIAH